MTWLRRLACLAAAATALVVSPSAQQSGAPGPATPPAQAGDTGRFKSGVDLVNVTATVVDASGRFVPGLRQHDFRVYEDGQPQTITHFSNERVPVSLGFVVDTSGSMAGDKLESAELALERFLDLMGPDDEFFVDRFSGTGERLQEWTTDRARLGSAIRRLSAGGGTAMYDALADAVPYASAGGHHKKAIVLISDGNDTNSATTVSALKQMVRESELLVYAVGIDGESQTTFVVPPRQPRIPIPIPFPGRPRLPFPIPGGGGGRGRGGPGPGGQGGGLVMRRDSDRVNAGALREITDDSGGRTEIVRSARDLDPATAHIADELGKQYYLAYQGSGTHDGRWHTIRVEVSDPRLRVRARRGYVAN